MPSIKSEQILIISYYSLLSDSEVDEFVKSLKIDLLSFRRISDPDPGFAGMTVWGLFTKASKLNVTKFPPKTNRTY